jgi:DNA-binding CsgD family transcriptional regulator
MMSESGSNAPTLSASTAGRGFYAEHIRVLAQVCSSLAAGADRRVRLRKVAEALAVALKADGVDIHLRTIAGDYMISCASYGDHFGLAARGETLISATTGRMSDLLRTGEPLIMDFENPDSRDRESKIALTLGYKSAVTTPIITGDLIIGTYSISRKGAWCPERMEIEHLCAIGRVLGVGIANAAFVLWTDMCLPDNLDDAERKLLVLISQGLSNEEIAKELFLSTPSVKKRIRGLLRKLGLETRAQAAVFAAHAGIA